MPDFYLTRAAVLAELNRTDEAQSILHKLQIPPHWAVFAIRDGRARTTPIQTGHRNNRVAEVLSGLSAGDQVILHPSDRIKDGVAVSQRDVH